MQRDHDAFLLQKPPAEAVTMFVLHSGYQSECLEIAAYHDLIDKASSLELQDCVLLFQQNLQQEVNASTTLATIAHQYGQQQVDAVQRSLAPPPMPNQTNTPMPDQSYAAANTQVPNQPSTTGNSSTTTQVQEGMQVVGSDMGNIGYVRQVRENDFLADIPMHRDLFVPFSAIQTVDEDKVVLNIAGDQIYDMDWPKPPLI